MPSLRAEILSNMDFEKGNIFTKTETKVQISGMRSENV